MRASREQRIPSALDRRFESSILRGEFTALIPAVAAELLVEIGHELLEDPVWRGVRIALVVEVMSQGGMRLFVKSPLAAQVVLCSDGAIPEMSVAESLLDSAKLALSGDGVFLITGPEYYYAVSPCTLHGL